jgi:hypothetical protein
MRRTGQPDTWQVALLLFRAGRSKSTLHPSASFLLPVVAALANLLFCAFFEQPIKGDPTGRLLSLFLFVEGLSILLVTIAHFATTGAEVFRKSLVMPVPASAHLASAIAGAVMNPVFQALVASTIFFLLIMYHASAAAVFLIPFFILVMAANIVTLASVAFIALVRRARPPGELAAYCALGTLGVILLSLYFHIPGALGLVPPMSLAADGITIVAAGGTGLSLLYGIAAVSLLLLTGLLGRRIP